MISGTSEDILRLADLCRVCRARSRAGSDNRCVKELELKWVLCPLRRNLKWVDDFLYGAGRR